MKKHIFLLIFNGINLETRFFTNQVNMKSINQFKAFMNLKTCFQIMRLISFMRVSMPLQVYATYEKVEVEGVCE